MVRKVCLDSDVIIGLLRKDNLARDKLANIDADFCSTPITTFELWYGRKETEPIAELLEWLEPLDMDQKAGCIAADIQRDLSKKGESVDLRDLFIAACCIKHGVELLTFNTKHFVRLQRFGLVLT